MTERPCRTCRHRYLWWFRNACRAEHVAYALIVHDAPWRVALCKVQRKGEANAVSCGEEGRFWEARG